MGSSWRKPHLLHLWIIVDDHDILNHVMTFSIMLSPNWVPKLQPLVTRWQLTLRQLKPSAAVPKEARTMRTLKKTIKMTQNISVKGGLQQWTNKLSSLLWRTIDLLVVSSEVLSLMNCAVLMWRTRKSVLSSSPPRKNALLPHRSEWTHIKRREKHCMRKR